MAESTFYFNKLTTDDQNEIMQSKWMKVLPGLLHGCEHRIKLYLESDSMSGGITKLLTDMDLCAAFLLKTRTELMQRHQISYPPGPSADDVLDSSGA